MTERMLIKNYRCLLSGDVFLLVRGSYKLWFIELEEMEARGIEDIKILSFLIQKMCRICSKVAERSTAERMTNETASLPLENDE